MKKVVAFGEVMGRFSPKGYLRIVQTDEYVLTFAGAEINAAVAITNLGGKASFVTKLPANDLAIKAVRTMRGYGVDLDDVVYGKGRFGIYFVEKGASQRPSKVIYDRKNSAIALAAPEDFNWGNILDDAGWFHFSGITPALGGELPAICLEALKKCKEMGITVSCDLNYRETLWDPRTAGQIMSKLMPYVDVCFANKEHVKLLFGIDGEGADNLARSAAAAKELADRFGIRSVAMTLRDSESANVNTWAGMLYQDGEVYASRSYRIHVVDRVGGGDAFAGGLIFALMSGYDPQKAIEFGTATACLKQATENDFSLSSCQDVLMLMNGDDSGRVIR